MRRRRGPESGAAALELALVLPLFLALVFGIFNYGWALYVGNDVRHAIERCSRLLILDPNTSESQLVEAVAERLAVADIEDVDLSMATETLTGGTRVARISWTYRYAVNVPFVPQAVFNFDNHLLVPLRET
ncbi:MAG TPA: TadE/TadG family type IV pilus assembly protein [Caulobacter sp.]|nr:TadE/TadG family type IV pilus assembly protein [Caulobacter sp.]